MVGPRHRPQQHLSAHAEVNDQRGIGLPGLGVQQQPQVFAAPIGSVDTRAQQPGGEVGGTGLVAAHRAGVVHPNRGDRLAHHVGLQAAAHHLDFGQLGHLDGAGKPARRPSLVERVAVSASSAVAAAFCSASFLVRPTPDPYSVSITTTAAVNSLSWSGPVEVTR